MKSTYDMKLGLLFRAAALSLSFAGLAGLVGVAGCASNPPRPATTTPPPMPTAVSLPPSDEMTVVHRESTRPMPSEAAEATRSPTTNLTPQNSALGKKLRLR
jgi:hypothetical protein